MFLGENNERKLVKKQNQPTIFHVEKQDSDEDLEDLDEEQIINIFKEENLLKKGPEELQQKKLFESKDGIIKCE